MTNREWLESLSDEDLADVLQDNWCLLICLADSSGYCKHNCECTKQILFWLKQEHGVSNQINALNGGFKL